MEHELSELLPGAKAKVQRLVGSGALQRRMMDMGIVPGVEIEVVRRAPWGGPLQLRLKGYYLAMRRQECTKIMVRLEPNIVLEEGWASR